MAEVTEAYVSSVFDLRGGDHVDGDHLAFWYDTGHGSGAIEKVRPATDDDRLAVSFLRRLRELEIERNRSK